MRIAQVAPLYESVPPKLYGGTERVVCYLTEELVRQGHEVTLFASGDSVTSARLIACCKNALRLDADCKDYIAHHVVLVENVFRHKAEFDVVHFHIDAFHLPLLRREPVAALNTLHGRLDIADLVPLYREFPDTPVVSISHAQRKPLPWLNWLGTVHHGLPESLYSFREEPGKYLAFLGRISPEKGVDTAIDIAIGADMPLKIAAKVDAADKRYFEDIIKPKLDHPLVEFVGEIGEREKDEFLGNAAVLLFPIDWPEPFGLVMIEAMACGTPVIAFPRGSVIEVLHDGVTGRIVRSVREAVDAVPQAMSMSRRRVRCVFEQRFTAERMALDYVKLYEKAIQARPADFRTVQALGHSWSS